MAITRRRQLSCMAAASPLWKRRRWRRGKASFTSDF